METLSHLSVWTWIVFSVDLLLRLVFSGRILRRRLSVGVTWAWLGFILISPFIGTIVYLMLGEYRLGSRRARRIRAVENTARKISRAHIARCPEMHLPEPFRPFIKATENFFESPAQGAENLTLLRDADEAFEQMIKDIRTARFSCDAEFYIWDNGGWADRFAEALIEAAARGVKCRVLVDAVGSKSFLKSSTPSRLRRGGVDVQIALPAGPLRTFIARPDLRLHRKIFVIDQRIGYTGSLNLADPRYFKHDCPAAPWVDASLRFEGPAVNFLQLVFLDDWSVETGQDLAEEERKLPWGEARGTVPVQVLPSGPAIEQSTIEQTVILALYMARKKIFLTTPYFIPSEAMLYALSSAARRGVDVTLIVPARVDSILVQYASQAFLNDLDRAGVKVALFKGGLLHTKSILIDETLSIFGSLNLDTRSLRINFEITMAIYDPRFAGELGGLLEGYLKNSKRFEPQFSSWAEFKQGLARLLSPLL